MEQASILAPGALEAAEERAKELKAVRASQLKRKKLIPLNNWVLIRKQEREAIETEGGIALAQDEERSDVGVVLAVAPHLVDSTGRPLDIQVGDVVLCTHHSLTIEDVERLTGDESLRTVRGEEIYFKIVDAEEVSCT